MKKTYLRIITVVVVILVISVIVLNIDTTAQTSEPVVVKLYSGDTLVGTWENARKGRVEGNTYVFTYGMTNREVRISGTYSVESAR